MHDISALLLVSILQEKFIVNQFTGATQPGSNFRQTSAKLSLSVTQLKTITKNQVQTASHRSMR